MNFSYRSRPQPRLPEVASHPITLLHPQERKLSFGCWDASLHTFFCLTIFCHELERGKTLRVAVLKLALPPAAKNDHCQPWSLHPGREIVSVKSLASPEAIRWPQGPKVNHTILVREMRTCTLRLYQFGMPLCLHFSKSKFCRNLRGHGSWMTWMMLLDVAWNFQLPRYLM